MGGVLSEPNPDVVPGKLLANLLLWVGETIMVGYEHVKVVLLLHVDPSFPVRNSL